MTEDYDLIRNVMNEFVLFHLTSNSYEMLQHSNLTSEYHHGLVKSSFKTLKANLQQIIKK